MQQVGEREDVVVPGRVVGHPEDVLQDDGGQPTEEELVGADQRLHVHRPTEGRHKPA